MKIAVASSDGQSVDSHFGRTDRFLIFDVAEQGWRFIEARDNVPPCRGQMHQQGALDAAATLLADCQGVIASQIGPGAIDVLIARGIVPFSISGDIDEALRAVKDSSRMRYIMKRGKVPQNR